MTVSKSRANLHYTLGLAVLACAAIGMQVAKSKKWLFVIKKPLPILKPLIDMDRSALAPYGVVELAPLSAEMVHELGTTEYINWVLRRPGPAKKSDREATLSVTYYTDVQDQVPHVPEECYFQSGNFLSAGDEKLTMRLESTGEDIAVRRLAFYPAGELVKRNYVYYTICVNGVYCSDRNIVRTHMADPWDTHLYYSKVEIAFEGKTEKDEAALDRKASELFNKALPELMKSHWPPRGSERGGMKTEAGRED